MKPTTRKQREAMKALYDRCPIYPGDKSADQIARENGWKFYVHYEDPERPDHVTSMYWAHEDYRQHDALHPESRDIVREYKLAEPITYTQFRRTIYQSHMGCLIAPWLGLTLGIEPDGYVHS